MANTIIVQRDTQLERQRAGFIALSLTNFTNDDEPTIAAGSVVEISGSLYSVTSNQSITGWAGIGNGPVWVKLVPDGTNPFTAEYTSTAPTWFDSKQGWYDGTGTDRYVAGLTKTGASGYAGKFLMIPRTITDGANTWTGNQDFTGDNKFDIFPRIFDAGVGEWLMYNNFNATPVLIPEGVFYALLQVDPGGGGIARIVVQDESSINRIICQVRGDDAQDGNTIVFSDGVRCRAERPFGTANASLFLFRIR